MSCDAREVKQLKRGEKEQMWPYLIHDLVVREDLCNIRCAYCWLDVDNVPMMETKRGVVGLKGASGLTAAERASQVAERVCQIVHQARQRCTYPILKLSGGELTVVPEWVDLIFYFAQRLSQVQLLTNGTTLGPDLVRRLCTTKNVIVQISLDGHTAEANRHRGLGDSGVKKILQAVEALVEGGIGVELNTVITSANADVFRDFVRWGESVVEGQVGKLLIQPRPVRDKGAVPTRATGQQVESLASYLQAIDSVVLPPSPYLARVAQMLRNGVRPWPCYVPYFVLGTNDSGTIVTCTCGHHLGVAGAFPNSLEVLSRGSDFEPHRSKSECFGCITQYELLSQYFEGEICESDLVRIPSLRGDIIVVGLRTTRDAIVNIQRHD